MLIFKNVFSRNDATNGFNFEDFVLAPEKVAAYFETDMSVYSLISETCDKENRNSIKRNSLPAGVPASENIMSFDFDSVRGDISEILRIVSLVEKDKGLACAQLSVSGGLVLYYGFDCSIEDFPFVYYKKYLELTLATGVNIDFLPDISRARYLSLSTPFFFTLLFEPLTESLKVGVLPAINAQVSRDGARRIIYGSR